MATLYRTTIQTMQGAALGAAMMLATACGGSLNPTAAPGGPLPSAIGSTSSAQHAVTLAKKFTFTTLDDQADPTFNQLLGINNKGVIGGYYGIGTSGHPNKGYVLDPPYGQSNYVNENFPGSIQTQVTAINNKGDTAGFWVNAGGSNRGWVMWNGVFASYTNPKTPKKAGSVNQLLGINDSGIAVGFYNDAHGTSHAYTLNQATGIFRPVHVRAAVSAVATGINSTGDIVGFGTSASKATAGFLIKAGHFSALQFPGGSNTQPFGVNDQDEIVGSYLDGSGVLHGFLLSTPLTHAHWESIDDPNGVGSTVVNGINNKSDLVGFYTDAAGNVDGMLATPF